MVTRISNYYIEFVDKPETDRKILQDLERDYENVPEPRRPREWQVRCYGDTMYGLGDVSNGELTRVIEWPIGAPLPEWPT